MHNYHRLVLVGSAFLALVSLAPVTLAQEGLFDAPVRNPGQKQLCNPCIDPPVRFPQSRQNFPSPGARLIVSADDMRTLGVISVADMVNRLPPAIAEMAPGERVEIDNASDDADAADATDADNADNVGASSSNPPAVDRR